ncbi:hypothetical protein HNY73_012783 [Argiope bruennichi]|uniref:Uncharacterized protein n=1 Tax=Argiope bruennichi TaxID=94029 RepID=A0A8T0F0J3_ARGBR|nr:hypothetical protein HNY73_012783 [Argiope bruennichi]
MPVAEQCGPKCKTGHLQTDGILHFLFQEGKRTRSLAQRPSLMMDRLSAFLRPDSAATVISSAVSFSFSLFYFPVPRFNDAVSGYFKTERMSELITWTGKKVRELANVQRGDDGEMKRKGWKAT